MNTFTNIVLGIDFKSVYKCKALINSIRENVKNPKIYLITDNKIDKDLQNLFDIVKIYNIPDNKPITPRHTKHVWTPIFIHEIFPDMDKCIYLDYDVIVLDDISELLNDDFIIKGADNTIFHWCKICTGVMALNLKNEKFIKGCEYLKKIIENNNNFATEFCKVFESEITKIDRIYNVHAHSCNEHIKNPKVIHYRGPRKPFNFQLYKNYFDVVNKM